MSDAAPVARYRLELDITANSMEDLATKLYGVSTDVDLKVADGRTTMEIVSGAGYILKVTEQNPEMTEERYRKELLEWSGKRRE